MKNDILKISNFGLELIYRKKRKELSPELLELKKIAENPYDIRHDLADFLLGMYGAYMVLNQAQSTNEHGTRENLKTLEQIWRE